ncbi:MAG: hypothetical protein AB7K09_18645, partial [Planctomycetota bacterium]
MDHLLAAAHDRRLILLLGPGLPNGIPTSVPSLWLVNEAIIDAVARGLGDLVGDDIEELAALVLNYQLTGRLPAEVPCASATRRDTSFARVLAALDGDQPVPLHHVIAALVKAGRLQAIITPNVDRALEAACEAIGATLEVVSGDEAFAAMASQVRETGGAPAAGCRLLRIYGCA